MALREALESILREYPGAKTQPLAGYPLATFIRDEAPKWVKEGLGELAAGLVIEGSPGAGNWAAVPWVSVFDPSVTTSATRGYYVVF